MGAALGVYLRKQLTPHALLGSLLVSRAQDPPYVLVPNLAKLCLYLTIILTINLANILITKTRAWGVHASVAMPTSAWARTPAPRCSPWSGNTSTTTWHQPVAAWRDTRSIQLTPCKTWRTIQAQGVRDWLGTACTCVRTHTACASRVRRARV